jgi:DNA modification methylase
MNTLYYGDNLKILRDYVKNESVDLIYLDQPFNSNRNYNVLFKDESGLEADSLEWRSKTLGIGKEPRRHTTNLSLRATRCRKCFRHFARSSATTR